MQSACDATFEMLVMACNRKLNMLKLSPTILRYLDQCSSNFPMVFTISHRLSSDISYMETSISIEQNAIKSTTLHVKH